MESAHTHSKMFNVRCLWKGKRTKNERNRENIVDQRNFLLQAGGECPVRQPRKKTFLYKKHVQITDILRWCIHNQATSLLVRHAIDNILRSFLSVRVARCVRINTSNSSSIVNIFKVIV